jgi:hypothetical protein
MSLTTSQQLDIAVETLTFVRDNLEEMGYSLVDGVIHHIDETLAVITDGGERTSQRSILEESIGDKT